MSEPKFVILLLGPTDSGKTAFVRCLTQEPHDGQSTSTCQEYHLKLLGRSFQIIDTPGLDDSPRANLAVLRMIAEKLTEITRNQLTVSGVIYFHRITDLRLTGSARNNIEILEAICGRDFLSKSRTAFVTTMWNRINQINQKEKDRYDTLHRKLETSHSRLNGNEKSFLKFQNDHESANDVMKRFTDKKIARPTDSDRDALQLEVEVTKFGPGASRVRKTEAGKIISSRMSHGCCTIL